MIYVRRAGRGREDDVVLCGKIDEGGARAARGAGGKFRAVEEGGRW